MNKFHAHISDDGRTQTVDEHLKNTAKLAEFYAIDELKSLARYAGLMHDIGKYRPQFQERIHGSDIRCEHAICGAQEIVNRFVHKPNSGPAEASAAPLLAYCVAGHHTGLQDGGSRLDNPDEPTLEGALKRDVSDYLAYTEYFNFELPNCNSLLEMLTKECNRKDTDEIIERFAFLTRYIYSCLTDADFIDTEQFFSPDADRGISGDFVRALALIEEKLLSFKPETDLQKTRKKLQEQAYHNVAGAEINILNMPTGSGKTLCSMRIALKRVVETNKKRIIYVIPYTSIIEQTAEEFQKVFKDILPVVQHHSNFSFEDYDEKNDTTEKKLKRICENWDAPLIITTNVQFFQSLYHNKSSRLRKLHNLADSVIVFDEIHMMPIEYIQPCLRAIGYVTSYLRSEAILLSATMPEFKELFGRYIKLGRQHELITDKSLFGNFAKCTYHYLGKCSEEKILVLSERYQSTLVIVNSRSEARALYKKCSEKKFHLSTYMTPTDRSRVIKDIRDSLTKNEKVIVISTSLIEAGVDLDFEAVFRELSGLDSVIQSGGRCNREGRRKDGDVYIFEWEEKKQNRGIGVKANICRSMINEYKDISSAECISDYYRRLYQFNDDIIRENSIINAGSKASNFREIPFRSYTEEFKFIDSDTIGVVIPGEENAKLLEALKYGGRSILRKLQKYSASVHKNEIDSMCKRGIIVNNQGVFILNVPGAYDINTGLDPDFYDDHIY